MHEPAGRGRCYGDLKNLVLLQSSQRAVNGCQQQVNQAAMSNNAATKVAWARMSRPPILRTCPFLTIAITS